MCIILRNVSYPPTLFRFGQIWHKCTNICVCLLLLLFFFFCFCLVQNAIDDSHQGAIDKILLGLDGTESKCMLKLQQMLSMLPYLLWIFIFIIILVLSLLLFRFFPIFSVSLVERSFVDRNDIRSVTCWPHWVILKLLTQHCT